MGIAPVAQAQMGSSINPVRVGIAAGAAFPLSDFGKLANSGYNATGTLAFNPPELPIGFRADAAYNQFSAKGASTTSSKVASVTGNVVLNMAAGTTATPYLIGGAGWYHVSSNLAGTGSANNFGFDAGAGINIPLTGFTTFIEARYNRVSTTGAATSFIPVTVGVMF